MPPIRRKVFKPEAKKEVEVYEEVEEPVRPRRKKSIPREEPEEEVIRPKKYEDLGGTRTLLANGVPCVYVEKGVTKNMGEYNSARVTIGMMLPIDYTPEDLKKAEKTISVIDKIIVARLEAEVDELLEE